VNKNEETKIRWHCRRGMLELDKMLHAFFDKEFQHLSEEEKLIFITLLEHTDQELYQWLIGMNKPSDSQLLRMIQKIQQANQ